MTAVAACLRTGAGCLSADAQARLWEDESQSLKSYGILDITEFKAPSQSVSHIAASGAVRAYLIRLQVRSMSPTFIIQSNNIDREVAQRKWLEKALGLKGPPVFLRTSMDKLRPYIES